MKITEVKTFLMHAGAPNLKRWAADGSFGHESFSKNLTGTRGWYFWTKDGKDVNVQGIANPAVREAYTRVDDRTFQRVVKLNGQVRNTLKLTVAPDGKSVTAVTTGTGADGKPFHATSLLNKQ